MNSLLDPRFKYIPAARTDIRKTFAKARRDIAKRHEQERTFANILRMKRA